jgi:hypothetical protein
VKLKTASLPRHLKNSKNISALWESPQIGFLEVVIDGLGCYLMACLVGMAVVIFSGTEFVTVFLRLLGIGVKKVNVVEGIGLGSFLDRLMMFCQWVIG